MTTFVRWYNNPTNHDAAVKIIADFTKPPEARFLEWILKNQDYYRDLNAMVDVEALLKNVDVQHELGLPKQPLDVRPYFDTTLAQEAVVRGR